MDRNIKNAKSIAKMKQRFDFHISECKPIQPNWPRGGWSLYMISGDDIAKRIEFGKDGIATRRDSWPGYVGMYETLDQVADAMKEVTASEEYR